MEAPEEEDTSVPVLFAEKDEVVAALRRLAASTDPPGEEEGAALLARITTCLEIYLEQSTLLDPHLEEMTSIIMSRASEIVMEMERQRLLASGEGDGPAPFPFQVCRDPQLHALFKAVYQLCRVRGHKVIVRLMPHEAKQLEPVLHALQSQDLRAHATWETRHGLLRWLSMLALVPFDITSIDSTLGNPSNGAGSNGNGYAGVTLVDLLLSLGKQYLADPGPPRDAAAACLSRLLARPDMAARCLSDFLVFSAEVLAKRAAAGNAADESVTVQTFLVIGVLSTLAALFKSGERERLLSYAPAIIPSMLALAAQGSSQPMLRKLLVKMFQRVGMAYLPPRVVAWRYQRGQRSLMQNLASSNDSAAAAAPSAPGSAANPLKPDEIHLEGCALQDEGEEDVPEELEPVVEQLLCGLRDRDTVVRWSAAKGVGRVTGRLPCAEAADDVVLGVLELFSEAETDAAWHGGCLALAELARRGLLLPSRLPTAAPAVCRALSYDVRRGHHSVGSHVRDAACYVCWAFARAYAPAALKPFVGGLSEAMLAAALFDREVNVRRAAAAAFQENVGRQGHENFAHGVDILTAADYFTLGNRSNAFLRVAPVVARFARYRPALVRHLSERILPHWDPEMRRLGAASLAKLVPLEPRKFAEELLPILASKTVSLDLLTRHGNCLAAAEVSLALAAVPALFPAVAVSAVTEVVPKVEAARLYRGRGGELMRAACCRLVECASLAGMPLPVKTALRLLDSVEECLRQPSADVQKAAAAALAALLRAAFPVGASGPSERLRARVAGKYTARLSATDNPAEARGLAMALGALPRRLAAPDAETLDQVLGALTRAADPAARVGEEPDADARVSAITAIADLCEEVGIGSSSSSRTELGELAAAEFQPVKLDPAGVRVAFDALLKATDDYAVDNRGDVGSWCRTAALRALERLTVLAVQAASPIRNSLSPDGGGGSGGSGTLCAKAVAEELLGDSSTGYARLSAQEGVQVTVETAYGRGRIRRSVAAGVVLEVEFAPPEQGWWYFPPDGIGLLKRSAFLKAEAAVLVEGGGTNKSSSPAGAEVCFTADMCVALLRAGLKQLSEKLDAARDCAGNVLERLLRLEGRSRLPHVPQRSALEAALLCPLPGNSKTISSRSSNGGGGSSNGGSSGSNGGGDLSGTCNAESAAKQASNINWASPATTFPRVLAVMSLAPYHDAVAAGLVVSTGGLTESVVKQSSAALLAWARAAKKAGDTAAIAKFAARLLRLFDEHPGDNRVLLPLLRTLDLLLSHDLLRELEGTDQAAWLLQSAQGVCGAAAAVANGSANACAVGDVAPLAEKVGSAPAVAAAAAGAAADRRKQPAFSGFSLSFGEELLVRCRRESRACRDVAKLVATAAVAAGLLDFGQATRQGALALMLRLLGHAFPRVRKQAAEAFYLKLLAAGDEIAPNCDDALEVLTTVVWDGDAAEAKQRRDDLARLLGVGGLLARGERGSGAARKEARPKVLDDAASYEALVRHAGY